MKKVYLLLILINTILFSKVLIGEDIKAFDIKNQFDKKEIIKLDTEKIIFVFSKETAHLVRTFLDTKSDDYLSSKNILFAADISRMPSLIKWFILDNLKEHKYNIALIQNEEVSNNYFDEKRVEQIMLVSLDKMKVIGIDYINNQEDLQNLIESK